MSQLFRDLVEAATTDEAGESLSPQPEVDPERNKRPALRPVKDLVGDVKPHVGRLQQWMLRGLRTIWLAFAKFPEQTVDDIDAMLQRDKRREVMESVQASLKNKQAIPRHHRRIILNTVGWLVVLLWTLSTIIMLTVNAALAQQFQTGYVLAFYSFLTSIFLPTPYELILERSAGEIGVVPAIWIASVAKALGVVLVLSLGPSANKALNLVLERYERASEVFHWLEAQLRRPWGLAVVFLLLSIPLGSDTFVVYLIAPLNVRRRIVVVIAFVAFAVRSALWLSLF